MELTKSPAASGERSTNHIDRLRLFQDTRCIKRFDYKRSAGWYVQIERRINGTRQVSTGRLFSDRLYGGPEEALRCARLYRDAIEPEFVDYINGERDRVRNDQTDQ